MSKTIVPTLLATALAAGAMMTAAPAKAETKVAIDWDRMLMDADYVMRRGAVVLDSPRCALAGCETDTNATARAPERVTGSHVAKNAYGADNSWFSLAPKFSLVARDWSSSYKVTGERLALVDTARLTQSTRMVLARIRANSSRISPFAQVGLGQWRIDPYLLPLNRSYMEIAAEAAVGLEMRVIGTWQVAVETSTTMLYREYREPRDMAAPGVQIWAASFASKVDF